MHTITHTALTLPAITALVPHTTSLTYAIIARFSSPRLPTSSHAFSNGSSPIAVGLAEGERYVEEGEG